MATPIFEIDALQHDYDGKTVLSVDRLEIQPASIVGLIGPNGSGKSTLLKMLGLIETPSRGTIRFKGTPVEPFSEAARFRITLLPQEPFLMKRNVFRNIVYGLKLRGNGAPTMEEVERVMSMVGLNGMEMVKRPWYALSGGETQRVALAARLALNPDVLLLDEPTASVDAASAQLIKEAVLAARQESKTTLIIASHDWPWLFEICDEVLHLFKGRIFGTGSETVIFGPWRQLEAGKWGKVLADGQRLHVPEPPAPDAAAIIDLLPAEALSEAARQDYHLLRGMVSRLSLEKKSGQVFATITVGSQPLTMRLTPEHYRGQHTRKSIYPGETIAVCYRPDHVRWI